MDFSLDLPASFQTFNEAITLAAGTTPSKLADLHLPGRFGKQTITFTNTGANPIDSSFYLARASIDGGKAISVISGAEFSSPDGHLLIDSPGFAWPIPAGQTFQLTIDMVGSGEFIFYAASTLGTNVTVQFCVPNLTSTGAE